jgi:hypothetical protein
MTILAGTILHVGGNNVIDRLQSAGFGNTKMPIEAIREVGNLNIVDKVPGEPDFTFSLESLDVSTEIEAWLTGTIGGGTPTTAPGYTDAAGTEYPIDGVHTQFVNIVSPWRDPLSSAGTIVAGHIVPGYFPTKMSYKFGVKENASETVELSGSTFYYHESAPVEHYATGDGATTAFTTPDAAAPYREYGVGGTTFRSIFGVIVNGVLQTKQIDYTTTPTDGSTGTATVTFFNAPPSGATIKFCYFTTAARAYPTSLNSSAVVKPAAVRGRNICVFLGSGGAASQLGAVQSASIEYMCKGQVERELCSYEVTGYTVLSTDVTGSVVIRSRDIAQFYSVLSKITGLNSASEVVGWLNINPIPLSVKIQNPKNPAAILKTLYVNDAMFDMPDASVKVNTPVDFTLNFESQTGTFSVYKGDSGF